MIRSDVTDIFALKTVKSIRSIIREKLKVTVVRCELGRVGC